MEALPRDLPWSMEEASMEELVTRPSTANSMEASMEGLVEDWLGYLGYSLEE